MWTIRCCAASSEYRKAGRERGSSQSQGSLYRDAGSFGEFWSCQTFSLILPYPSSFPSCRILKPAEKKSKYAYGGMNAGRPVTPPRKQKKGKEGKA